MCETIAKAYVPHNVAKEQGRLNLKVEERDLWGKQKNNIKSIWQRLVGGGRANKQHIYFIYFLIKSIWQRLGGGVRAKKQI